MCPLMGAWGVDAANPFVRVRFFALSNLLKKRPLRTAPFFLDTAGYLSPDTPITTGMLSVRL